MTVAAPEATGALAIRPDQTEWTEVQRAAFASIGLADVPDPHRLAFLHLCQAKGLDPWQGEIFLIGRRVKVSRNPDRWEVRYTSQTGIAGYLTLAESTDEYEGSDIEWRGRDGKWHDVWESGEPPVAARAVVYRRGRRPVARVAHWAEYAPFVEEWTNGPNGRMRTGNLILEAPMWRKMPSGQIAKCALALALRAAFPRRMAGLHVDEEMHQADAAAREEEIRRQAEARDEALAEIRGELAPVTRADLEAEFRGQAAVLGLTPEKLAARWSKAHGRPLAEASDEELHEVVLGYRAFVAEAARTAVVPDAGADPDPGTPGGEPASGPSREEMLAELAGQARALGRTEAQHVTRLLARHRRPLDQVPDDALAEFLELNRPVVEEARRASPAGDGHPFVPDDDEPGSCAETGCGLPSDDAAHAPRPGPGQAPLL